MMLLKGCIQYDSKFENLAVATGLEKVSFHSNPKEKAMLKNALTTTQLHSFHMPARSCSKSSKQGFNSTWTENFQIYELDLEKAEEPENKLSTSAGSQKKQGNSRETSIYFCFTD